MAKLLNGTTVIATAPVITWDETQRGWHAGDTVYLDPGRAYTVQVVPATITRLQLIMGLMQSGLITPATALAASNRSAIPSNVDAIFVSLGEPSTTVARLRWNDMTICERASPILAAVAAGQGLTSDQMDANFIAWAAL